MNLFIEITKSMFFKHYYNALPRRGESWVMVLNIETSPVMDEEVEILPVCLVQPPPLYGENILPTELWRGEGEGLKKSSTPPPHTHTHMNFVLHQYNNYTW